jgi:septum formation inhibitor-activating ATPase MinD
MSTKPNISSFRYSDEVARILESFEGDSRNAKFENLVLFCYKTLPAKKKEIKQVQEQIDAKWARYKKLCTKISEAEAVSRRLEDIWNLAQKLFLELEEKDL